MKNNYFVCFIAIFTLWIFLHYFPSDSARNKMEATMSKCLDMMKQVDKRSLHLINPGFLHSKFEMRPFFGPLWKSRNLETFLQ